MIWKKYVTLAMWVGMSVSIRGQHFSIHIEPDTLNKHLSVRNYSVLFSHKAGKQPDFQPTQVPTIPIDSVNTLVLFPNEGKYHFLLDINNTNKVRGEITVSKSLSAKEIYTAYGLLLISSVLLIYLGLSYRFAYERKRLNSKLFESTEKFIRQQESYERALSQRDVETESLDDKKKDKGIRYKMVTVLFSNVVGFSKLTEQDNAERLIDDLDKFYFYFDNTVKRLNIKKIKTIGDTYLCAGGIPKKNRTNPIEVVLAAFEMQQYMNQMKSKYPEDRQKIWGLRIGIHTGPVFAQFENIKSQKYEIWGETVNIANRVEATGELGKVSISASTYELVRDYFLCQYYGKLPVKYRGDIDLYIIEGFRPLLSVENRGLVPNKAFEVKLAFIRFDDLEEEILDKLERELPKNLYYHNVKHTIDVVNQVEIIGRKEEVTDEELLLLKTAALFHDVGFTVGYKDHELLGIKIVKETLPRFHYSEEQINTICDLIFATRLPPNPKNKLEEIICDADLDYLGRADFIPVSNMLFKELVENGAIEDDIDRWNQMQFEFISKHQYFTKTAKELRDVNKNKQLETIKNQLTRKME